MAVNLLAALDDERYGASALARAHDAAARAGCTLRRADGPDALLAAWIDLHFAPSWWSFEAGAGSAWIAERDGAIAGFAAFGARGLKFRWLRAWRDRDDAGIFGPYGVAEAYRGSGIGEVLLTAALCGLRASGCASALIPAVSGEKLIASYVRRTGAAVVDEFTYDTGPFRATILASGAGTNARSVLERVRDGRLPLDVCAVVANDARAGALDAAREYGVDAVGVVWDRANETRASFDERVIDAVARTEPQLVLLLGWMHLLPPAFLRRFPETINLHPSFLPLDPAADRVVAPDGTVIPALRGAHALRDAVRYRIPWSGVTVHYVTEATDRGAVLVRVPVAVGEATDEAALRERIRPIEFDAVAAAIRRWSFER
jgi:phosphoribosylglycinamide formyltransferase-1